MGKDLASAQCSPNGAMNVQNMFLTNHSVHKHEFLSLPTEDLNIHAKITDTHLNHVFTEGVISRICMKPLSTRK